MKLKAMIAATLVSVFVMPAFAQTSAQRIDDRQAVQKQKIDEGVKSGELTKQEATRLDKGQNKVQRMENRAAADGKITAAESARIERAQNQQNKRIDRLENNRRHDRDHDGKRDRPAKKKS